MGENKNQAGKGSRPRNLSEQFRKNYLEINWRHPVVRPGGENDLHNPIDNHTLLGQTSGVRNKNSKQTI